MLAFTSNQNLSTTVLTSKSSSPTKGVGLDRQKAGGHLLGRYTYE